MNASPALLIVEIPAWRSTMRWACPTWVLRSARAFSFLAAAVLAVWAATELVVHCQRQHVH